jgi:hypothetical protein
MDSYKFWTVSSGILYHSSWRTSSDCFRDVGSGNLFLTLISKTDQNGSIMLKSDGYAGQGRCWSSSSCSSNHNWTVPAVWIGVLSSCKTASLFGSNVRIKGCTWLPNLFTYSLAVIRPWRVIMGPTQYCTTILLPKPSQTLPRISLLELTQELRIVGFLGCSPNVKSSWCKEQREGRLIWPNDTRVSSCLRSMFTVVTQSCTHLSITFNNQR